MSILRPGGAALLLGLVCVQPAQAQSRAIAFQIAPQPLAGALQQLASQAGMNLLFDPALAGGRAAPGLQGSYTVRDALRRLLEGSGLAASLRAEGIVVRAAPSAGEGAVNIGALRVRGASSAPGALSDDEMSLFDRPYLRPGSLAAVTREQIERFRGTSPADMFKGVAGVQVGESRNSGSVDVNVRGLQGQGRVPVVIDGSVQSVTAYRGYGGVADRNYLDPDLIGGVTVDKGPVLSAQGAGAIGGLVKMDTLKAEDILLPGERRGVRLRGGLQSNSAAPPAELSATPRQHSPALDGRAGHGSVAAALREDRYELVGAFAYRDIGNYFSGKHGHERYVVKNDWMSSGTQEDVGVTRIFKPGEEVLNTANRSRSLLLKGTLKPDAERSLELGFRRYDSDYGEIMTSQIVRNDGDSIPQWPRSQVRVDAYTARFKWQPDDNPLLKLQANLWHTDMDSRAYNGDVFRNPAQGKPRPGWGDCDACIDFSYLAPAQAQRTGADLSNSSLLRTRLGALKFDYGVSLQHERLAPGKGFIRDEDDILNNRNLRDGSRDEQSAFIGVNWAPADWLSFDLGGRYLRFATQDNNVEVKRLETYRTVSKTAQLYSDDTFEYLGEVEWKPDAAGNFTDATNPFKQPGATYVDGSGQAQPLAGAKSSEAEASWRDNQELASRQYRRSQPYRRRDSGFAPSFGVNLKLSDAVTGYLRYVEGLRMPSLMESTLGSSTPFLGELKPERSQNWEIGVSVLKDGLLRGDDRFRFKLAYFDNTTRDYITRRPIPGKEAWEQNFSMVNMDRYQLSGVELQSSYDGGALFGELSATYNRRTRICDRASAEYFRGITWFGGEHPMANTPECTPSGFSSSYVRNHIPPRFNLNLTLGGRVLDRKLSFGSRVTYNSEPVAKQGASVDGSRWESWNGTANQVLTRAYALVDVFASYKVSKGVSVDFAIDNLTDRYYLDPLALSLMPGPGRTARLNATWQF
ncbi:TonB-dependent receptor [Chromobacterium vaccinii]|uniref:TonB-dependent receptor n=1 Tax=Chromobacterium vaccinii TaxID=1108595 RepID=UPI000697231E|nr:TonB-dependent receptor [Chromobacterium vaccinii]